MPETKQAVIVRFGEPQRILNNYRPGEPFGRTGAGLAARIPFLEQIVWIDKRIQSIDMENQQVLSTDQLRLQVDAFARYRIVDPLRMYISAGTEERVSEQLRPILGSALRNELGRRPFAALLSPERGQMMDNIQNALNRVARQYGARDRRRADQARRSARRHAARFRLSADADRAPAGGALDRGAGLQAGADHPRRGRRRGGRAPMPEPSTRIPDFYDFYRAMQSYEASFISPAAAGDNQRGRTNIILSPNNEYLRQFRGNR